MNKIYTYGQERQAALDALFLLLNIWHIPASYCWYVKSGTFEGADRWENGEPMA